MEIDAIAKAVESNGGKVIMPKVAIRGVGRLIFLKPRSEISQCPRPS